MKHICLFLIAILSVTFVYAVYDDRYVDPLEESIRDQYFIVLDKNVPHLQVLELMSDANIQWVDDIEIGNLFAYLVKGDEYSVSLIANHPAVRYYEKNAIDTVKGIKECKTVSTPAWGVSRVSLRDLPVDNQYRYDSSGVNVNAYVIDTGMNIRHVEFEGRASHGYNAIEGREKDGDFHGHGTHVGGTVGSANYGLARNVNLVDVKVMDGSGRGTKDLTIQGIQWVATHAKQSGRRGVANLSLGGSYHRLQNEAINELASSGVVVVVAAGNENADACFTSPASAELAITVASATVQDDRSSFSNIGECVDIIAPGSNIISLSHRDTTGTTTMSGTSMASPHTAGVVALALEEEPNMTPEEIKDLLLEKSSKDIIDLKCAGSVPKCEATPNKFLHWSC